MRKRLTVSRRYPSAAARAPWAGSAYGASACRAPEPVPFVRISGKWLRRLGFSIGTKIEVEAERGRLVLTAAPEGSPAGPGTGA